MTLISNTTRRSDDIVFSRLELDRDSRKSLQSQIYQFFRDSILSGQLARGDRLPSTRALAKQWSVSRTTLVCTFEKLIAEGYLVARKGATTRVADELPDIQVRTTFSKKNERHFQIGLSRQGKKIMEEYESRGRAVDEARPFRPGVPAIGTFPRLLWRRLSSQVWTNTDPGDVSDMDSQGHLPLREQIAKYVQDVRGVNCNAQNIFVVTSTQHAISLICQVLIDPGASIAIESPGYPRAYASFSSHGAKLIEMRIDDEGMVFRNRSVKPRAIYTTPSCQYPLGQTMSLNRRLELLDWSRRNRSWIIEDDYASEFRYAGRPVAALQGLDTDGRVIYLGTFNKIFSPALRLGYIVVPDSLKDAFAAARSLIDRCPSFIDQAVLAKFIQRGHFGQHIRKMRTLYKERETFLRTLLNNHVPVFDVPQVAGGMHLIAWLRDGVRDVDLCQSLLDHGVSAKPISSFYLGRKKHNGILLGFTGWNQETASHAVTRIESALGSEANFRRHK